MAVHLIVKENVCQVVRANVRLIVKQYDRRMIKNMSDLVKGNGL
jgi:hypothetical protein